MGFTRILKLQTMLLIVVFATLSGWLYGLFF